jgi:hypothetical protein
MEYEMKKAAIAVIFALASVVAHADSISDYVQFEAGIGGSHISDMGDGVWVQQGAPNNREKQTTPAFMAGFTGPLYQNGAYDVRWHLDYTYIDTYAASVDGVPDENYNPITHQVVNMQDIPRLEPFNGQGHTQGVPLTLDAGYTWHGYRFGVEAGAWVYWQTWHESLYALDNEWHNLSHKTVPQLGYIIGARVERGNFALSYRYYNISQKWTDGLHPGLATGAHVLMATYRF